MTNFYRVRDDIIVFGPGTLAGAASVDGLPKTSSPHLLSTAEREALGIYGVEPPSITADQTRTFVGAVYNSMTDQVDETWNVTDKRPAVLTAERHAQHAAANAGLVRLRRETSIRRALRRNRLDIAIKTLMET